MKMVDKDGTSSMCNSDYDIFQTRSRKTRVWTWI